MSEDERWARRNRLLESRLHAIGEIAAGRTVEMLEPADDIAKTARKLADSLTFSSRPAELEIAAALQAERSRWQRMSLEQWRIEETVRAEMAEQQAREHIAVATAALKRAEAAEGKLRFAEEHMRTEISRAMESEKRVRELETRLAPLEQIKERAYGQALQSEHRLSIQDLTRELADARKAARYLAETLRDLSTDDEIENDEIVAAALAYPLTDAEPAARKESES